MADANTESADFLDGKLLVAMPGMGDTRFERSVVFMCAHSREGAMGLIVNKPTPELQFADLLKQLEIPIGDTGRTIDVHFGGPVEHGRGFVLHSNDYHSDDDTMEITEQFGMTATMDILRDIAKGEGPTDGLLALGYAGWGPGQLESEFRANGWLICEARPDIIFAPDAATKWEEALKSIGVTPSMLAAAGGSA